jgi:predicted RecA/RadA family phage recombinase
MATRPQRQTQHALKRYYTVAASQTCTVGKTVKLASDTTVQDAGAGSDLEIGICMESSDANASGVVAAGFQVEILLLGHAVVPMLVGTGASTRSKKQVVVSDGITDAAASGGGTTAVECIGIALESGVAGDLIGVLVGGANSRVSA